MILRNSFAIIAIAQLLLSCGGGSNNPSTSDNIEQTESVRESSPTKVEFVVFWGVSIFGCLLFWTVMLSLLLG